MHDSGESETWNETTIILEISRKVISLEGHTTSLQFISADSLLSFLMVVKLLTQTDMCHKYMIIPLEIFSVPSVLS
jgi:hypothetical protein